MWNAVAMENTHKPSFKKQHLEDKNPNRNRAKNCMITFYLVSL